MLKSTTLSQLYVLDQDQALDFYVGKLGMEVTADYDLGFMRWLTVSLPGDGREVLLERPGPPAIDEATAAHVRDLLTKGAAGGWLGFTTDDCRATFEALKGKGVEITQEPVEQFYGVDIGLRDPFGNNIRIVERKELPADFVPPAGSFPAPE
jgi:catechol 2,3-dioxygenase-like lactoylglutathione lyase family enzyme